MLLGEILRITVLAGLAVAGIVVVLLWKKNLATKVTFLRFIVQATAVVAIFYLYTFPIWLLLVLGVLLIMTLVLGRFFCGWLCPFGFYMDLITMLRKAFKVRYRLLPDKLNRSLHKLRYFILIFFLILPFLLEPIDPGLWSLAPYLAGPFRPMSVLLGPLEPLIIPWQTGIEVAGINISYPYLTDIIYHSGGISLFSWILVIVFVGLTVAGSFTVRRVWCRFCPTGASLAIINRFKIFKFVPALHIDKEEEKCTKCGICKRVCPLQVNEVYEQKGGKIKTSMCMLCFRCVEMCPYEGCLKVKFGGKTAFESRNWLKPSDDE